MEYAQHALQEFNDVVETCQNVHQRERRLRVTTTDISEEMTTRLKTCSEGSYLIVPHDFQAPLFSQVINNETDVLLTYDLDLFPDDRLEAKHLGLFHERVRGGRYAIAFMKTHRLATKEELCSDDLRYASVTVNSAVHFKRTCVLHSSLFGEDLQLLFISAPCGDIANLATFDYGDSIMICHESVTDRYFAPRGDMIVHKRLDREPIDIVWSLVCKRETDNLLVEPFVEKYLALYGLKSDQRATEIARNSGS